MFDNIIDYIGRCIIDTTSLFNFGFFFYFCLTARGKTDYAAQEFFIYLAKNIRWQYWEFIWTIRIVESMKNVLNQIVIN